MLRYLKITNLAIIDKVEVEFREGFNVLTGETGAGKSILIGALDLLLGGRAAPDMIRAGEEEAQVEGLFEVPNRTVLPLDLQDETADAGELLLSRKFYRAGRSRCSVNGNLATVAVLQSVGRSLVSIFGQHEHRVLLDPEEHVEILDQFAALKGLRADVSAAYSAWTKATRELADAARKLQEIERQAQENVAAIEELTAADLKAGEEDELVQDREILKKASQIRERAYDAYQRLYSRSGSIMGELSEVKKALDYVASANPKLEKLRDNFEEARYRLEDVALELREVTEKHHADPARLERMEDRLATLRKLKKKYGKDMHGLINYVDDLAREAGDILDARATAKNRKALVEDRRQEYIEKARQLSSERRKAAATLETAMRNELKELAMPTAEFKVDFLGVDENRGGASGLEKVEFFLASNPGEPARPLAKVASGGELSRIMLALKALRVDEQGASTVIFDEVDTGVGGHTAFAVGTRLSRVAQRQQVLCVTHLHQVAALADHHLSVTKSVKKGRTRIEVRPLTPEQRVDELARMLGAPASSESAREHVRRLMDLRVAGVS